MGTKTYRSDWSTQVTVVAARTEDAACPVTAVERALEHTSMRTQRDPLCQRGSGLLVAKDDLARVMEAMTGRAGWPSSEASPYSCCATMVNLVRAARLLGKQAMEDGHCHTANPARERADINATSAVQVCVPGAHAHGQLR